ncbi:MAG: hypothetical protein ACLQFW_15400, partial [Xanthobacteraceae bacterium]
MRYCHAKEVRKFRRRFPEAFGDEDITAEVDVFEALFARDAEAMRAGVTLMPGVGFDVVPSDCLAAHRKTSGPILGRRSCSRPCRSPDKCATRCRFRCTSVSLGAVRGR